MRKHKRHQAPSWPERDDRTRVLVEDDDGASMWSIERILTRAGYAVATCPGPEGPGHDRCPLVAAEGCALAAGADVIVNELRLSQPENRGVVRALRAWFPDTPVVVEVPEPEALHYADVLVGCRRLGFPATSRRLIEAVEAAEEHAPDLGAGHP